MHGSISNWFRLSGRRAAILLWWTVPRRPPFSTPTGCTPSASVTPPLEITVGGYWYGRLWRGPSTKHAHTVNCFLWVLRIAIEALKLLAISRGSRQRHRNPSRENL